MRTLNALADGIALDVSDLLHSAKVYLQMSREDLPEEHVVQDYLDRTLDSLTDAEGLVEQLLALSQLDRSEVRERVDLAPLVKEVLSLAQSSFPSGFTLRTRLEEDCVVVGNRAQLQQLVADLVTNAGESMEGRWDEQPTVLDVSLRTVTADVDLAEQYLNLEAGQYVHLAVSDTGGGTEEEVRPHRAETGAGVAEEVDDTDPYLSVAQDIVETHDGALTVRNEPGEGTTFNVYLPRAAPEEPAPEPPARPAPETSRHVLVVDDDRTVRNLEGLRLSRLGYEVTGKPDAESALEVVREDPEAFDIALIDYHMPDMNGLELVHALREEGCQASVILMTGLSAQLSEAKARVVGIDRLLQKPIESHELSEVLAQLGG